MKHEKNENYFENIDSEDKAYFLGLLMADGWNSDNSKICISLHERDKDILVKFSHYVFNKENLTYYDPKTYTTKAGVTINASGKYQLGIHSKKFTEHLLRLGMTTRKSLTLQFPSIPPHLLNHFVRGYFDGDGCLSKRKHNGATRYIVAIAGSLAFLSELEKHIKKELLINCKISPTKTKISMLNISGNRQIQIFSEWLYAGATLYLTRKYQKYLDLVTHNNLVSNKPKSSKYAGVSYDRSRKMWQATFRKPNKTIYIGRYHSEENAYAARQTFIHQHESRMASMKNGGPSELTTKPVWEAELSAYE